MRFKYFYFALMMVILAVPAFAQEKVIEPAGPGTQGPITGKFISSAYSGRAIFEGFEDDVPPQGWDAIVTNSNNTWGQEGDGWAIEGTFSARVWPDWETAQDESLSFEHTVDVAGGSYVLSFWAAGASGQTWDLGSRETVEINGVEVWNFDDEVTYGHHLYFEQYFVDMSAWDGQTVTISFRYEGVGGGSLFVDAVLIDDGDGWSPDLPPVPDNDTCESAMANEFFIPAGEFSIQADNTTATRDYALTYQSCVYYGFTGRDLVWVVCMEAGDVLSIEMSASPWWDEVFWLATDCDDPINTCVAFGDEPPTMTYTATEAGTYYLICGGWSPGREGPFTLNGNLLGAGCGAVSTEDTNWGNLKAIYR